jgi:hypothetical protein
VLCAEILQCVEIAEERVCKNLKNILSKISFTFNAWTSAPSDPYLSLTAHFISAPADCPDVWELKTDQLIFQEIQGRHTGKNMVDILSQALDRYNLWGKVRLVWHSFLFYETTEPFHRLGGLPVMVQPSIAQPYAFFRIAPLWELDGRCRNMICCEWSPV